MIFEEDRKPEMICTKNIVLALMLHAGMFLVFYLFATLNLKPNEVIMPIELTFEAPPAPPTEVPPERVKPKVVRHEDPPKVDANQDAIEKIVEKPKPKEKKVEKPKEKKVEKPKEKKPDPKPKEKVKPKLTRAERLAQMRGDAKVVNEKAKPTPVAGPGQKLDKDWNKLFNQGYKAGATTQLAKSEQQRCISLIQAALDEKWAEMTPEIGQPGLVQLQVDITSGGRLTNCRIIRSCNSAMSDRAALSVARAVGVVSGLSPEFIANNRTVVINYNVRAR